MTAFSSPFFSLFFFCFSIHTIMLIRVTPKFLTPDYPVFPDLRKPSVMTGNNTETARKGASFKLAFHKRSSMSHAHNISLLKRLIADASKSCLPNRESIYLDQDTHAVTEKQEQRIRLLSCGVVHAPSPLHHTIRYFLVLSFLFFFSISPRTPPHHLRNIKSRVPRARTKEKERERKEDRR